MSCRSGEDFTVLLSGRKPDDVEPATSKTAIFAFAVYFAAIAAVFVLAAMWIGDAVASGSGPII